MDLRELPGHPVRRHPWEVARARFFETVLLRWRPAWRAPRVLDLGAGDGYLGRNLLARMPAGSSLVCFDPHYTDDHLQQLAAHDQPGVTFVRQSPDGVFDLVLLLDVIEHVADDRIFLSSAVARHLETDGVVLISVPAWMSLFTQHDVFLGHQRRYRPAEMRRLIDAAGLRPIASGGLFHGPLLVRAGQKLNELRRGVRSRPGEDTNGVTTANSGTGHWNKGPVVTGAASLALRLDNRVSLALARAGVALPGLSLWALCARK